MLKFLSARYVTSSHSLDSFPQLRTEFGAIMKEIAIVGRSNVGKSSLINHLTNKKGLAKASATPGKTQAVNFFSIDEKVALVDLPGYGYAKVSKEMRQKWGELIDAYLEKSEQLHLILFLLDSRRELAEEDIAFMQWATFHQKPIVIIFTKVDKLNAKEKHAHSAKTLEHLKGLLHPLHYLYYSIKDSKSRAELAKKINTLLPQK